jgi:hypothetical protein
MNLNNFHAKSSENFPKDLIKPELLVVSQKLNFRENVLNLDFIIILPLNPRLTCAF